MRTAPLRATVSMLSILSLLPACGDEALLEQDRDPSESTDPGAGQTIPAPSDGAVAPGSDAGADADAGAPGGPAQKIPFACPAGAPTIAAGANTLRIDDKDRTFYVDLPKASAPAPAVLLSFHGFGQPTEQWRSAVALDPDAVPGVPMIVVTPDDRGLQPPLGLDWDIVNGRADTPNPDVTLVEAILGCLAAQRSVDASRVYAMGFSAGSVFTSMLHSRHPQLFAAIVTASGAWMNDPAEVDLVNPLLKPFVRWKWTALDPKDSGNVLITHGGASDKVAFDALPIEQAAQEALSFLRAAKRTVVDCPHDGGHALHPDLSVKAMSGYLAAHRLGTPSPFAGAGDLTGLPASCRLVP